MAVNCTEQNNRDAYFQSTLMGLFNTVDFKKHRLGISINGHTEVTLNTIKKFESILSIKIFNPKNIGTSEAVNKIWQCRKEGEHGIKMDDDIYIQYKGWVDALEDVVNIEPKIGQCGLKRKDCWEKTTHPDPFYQTVLHQLPHEEGEKWRIVEIAHHIMGSCVLHSSLLLDKVGYLLQPSLYGGDDSLMSHRSEKAGFQNVFLPHIEIDHLDVSPPKDWQSEKEKMFHDAGQEFFRLRQGILDGSISYYYNPFQNEN